MMEDCTVKEFCRRHKIGRSTFYKLVKEGKLATVKCGKRTLVPSDSEQAWCESLRAAWQWNNVAPGHHRRGAKRRPIAH
jgi:excisionase family DNA binding protein